MRPKYAIPFWFVLLMLISAMLCGYLIVLLAENASRQQRAVLGAEAEQSDPSAPEGAVATPTLVPAIATLAPPPTPAAPVVAATEPAPINSVPAAPSSVPLPDTATPAPPVVATATTAPQITPPPLVPVPAQPPDQSGVLVRLDDDAWRGGYNLPRVYGGRSAMWIYGTNTPYNAMQAAWTLQTPPTGSVALTIEGMDSEGSPKTPILITINEQPIFQAANPLPDDDLPLDSGTWARATFPFDAALLQPGVNTIRITNLARGNFRAPPFFMLDYAQIVVDQSPPSGAALPPAPSPTDPPASTATPTQPDQSAQPTASATN